MGIHGIKSCTKWKTEKNFSTLFLKNEGYNEISIAKREMCI